VLVAEAAPQCDHCEPATKDHCPTGSSWDEGGIAATTSQFGIVSTFSFSPD
jgi:hypothetical protein